jgi:hypothetical protein
MRQPATKASVRNSPDSTKDSATPPPMLSGLSTSVEVRKTTMVSGTKMTPIVRNWRFR